MSWDWLLDNAGEILATGMALVALWRGKKRKAEKVLETARRLDQAAHELKLFERERELAKKEAEELATRAQFEDAMSRVSAEADKVPELTNKWSEALRNAGIVK